VLEVGKRTCVVEGRREEGGSAFPPPTNSLKPLQVPVKHVVIGGWGARCDAMQSSRRRPSVPYAVCTCICIRSLRLARAVTKSAALHE
jgi:hypothetical protein